MGFRRHKDVWDEPCRIQAREMYEERAVQAEQDGTPRRKSACVEEGVVKACVDYQARRSTHRSELLSARVLGGGGLDF